MAQSALIIGASRGLGLGLAHEYATRGWTVIGTVRGDKKTGLHDLAAGAPDRVSIEQLEITDQASIAALARKLAGHRIDVLFVNSGVSNGPKEKITDATDESFMHVMTTNVLGPLRTAEALEPLVPAGGTIAMMSSGLGSVANNQTGGWEVYRASKAALNTLMRSFAVRHAAKKHSLLVIAPGWVRTDMGGANADLDVETSIRGVVDVLTSQAGHAGLQYLNYKGETLPW